MKIHIYNNNYYNYNHLFMRIIASSFSREHTALNNLNGISENLLANSKHTWTY